MDSYVTNRDVDATERYGEYVNFSSTYLRNAVGGFSGTNSVASSSYTSSNSYYNETVSKDIDDVYLLSYSNSYTGRITQSTAEAAPATGTSQTGSSSSTDSASDQISYGDSTARYSYGINEQYTETVTDTYETLGTYVSFDTVMAYQSNEVIVSNGNFNFPYWSTSSSNSTQTAWTNATQTKTSTTITYWNTVMSSLPRNTSSSTRTINASQNYSYNTTSEDSFTEYSDYTYTATNRYLGGSNYLRDTIVFNNASIGGSSYLNGGAAYTLSAAVGLTDTVTGKFTDLFGLQTSPMFTFSDNQVFLTSSRNDLTLIQTRAKISSVISYTYTDDDDNPVATTSRGIYYQVGTVSMTKTGTDTTFYTEKWTTNYSFTGVGSYAINYPPVGTGTSAIPSYSVYGFSHTIFEWGYSYPTNAVAYYTSRTVSTSWGGDAPEETGTKMFYQTKTYTTNVTVNERGEATTTFLVNSYVSYLNGTATGQSFVGSIRKTSTITYLKKTITVRNVVCPKLSLEVDDYTYSQTNAGDSFAETVSAAYSRTDGTRYRMEAVKLTPLTEFASDGEFVHSCLPIGYAGAANSYNASLNVTGINVARSAVISMVAGTTFNTQDVLATSHLPTAEFFDHVTYFPDNIPSSWTIMPQNAESFQYISSVASMGSPASIKVWWTATTSITTTFPSYKVFKGATSASKLTTASRYTVCKATYVLSTVGAITGDFLTAKPISLIGMGNGFSTGYCDINTSNMPTPVSVKFPAGAVDITYQVTGNSGALSSGTFSSSNSNGQVSFAVTNGKPFAFLAQPIYSFIRSYMGSAMNADHIVSTFKYIPPASY